MSKFIDRLNQVTQAVPQSMGFKTTQCASSKPKILLIASLAPEAITGSSDYLDGATAVLLRPFKSRTTAKTIKDIIAKLPDKPWGVCLDNGDDKTANALIDAGCGEAHAKLIGR